MMKLKYISIIGLILLAFFSNAQKPRYIKTDTYEGVIFPMLWATDPIDAKYAFSPTKKEIAIMEKKLTGKIGDLLSNFEKKKKSLNPYDSIYHCLIVENLKRYKRQYTGSWKNGDKVILVQFFMKVPEDWKKVQIITGEMGSGCVEFRLFYSITSGKFFGFFIDLSRL